VPIFSLIAINPQSNIQNIVFTSNKKIFFYLKLVNKYGKLFALGDCFFHIGFIPSNE
jgi:hypothetical protein